ncbi:hypothetical protein [Pedobacter aquatilis]|uniref:hypothetical protein n=1 Tax=Pedobacter aquatilis TaxID=351343 RepID=UPI00292FDA79|nr:hypothetical protein [Pedobacter aquatilis]
MTEKYINKANILIELMGFGIIELPVDYTLQFSESLPKKCTVECHIGSVDAAFHSWIQSKKFSLIFSEIEIGKGYIVSFICKGLNKNIYYKAMLNGVSDYIFNKDETLKKQIMQGN